MNFGRLNPDDETRLVQRRQNRERNAQKLRVVDWFDSLTVLESRWSSVSLSPKRQHNFGNSETSSDQPKLPPLCCFTLTDRTSTPNNPTMATRATAAARPDINDDDTVPQPEELLRTQEHPSNDHLEKQGHALQLTECDHVKGLGIFVPPIKEQRRVFTHGNGTAFCLNEEENEAAVDLHVKLAKAFHDGKRKVKALQDEAMATGGPGANAAAEKAVESCRSKLKDKIIRDEIERCVILGECDADESTLPRQVKHVSTVFTSFNARDVCNKKLEEITIICAKIRLGHAPDRANPCEGDELQAMILDAIDHKDVRWVCR